MIPTLRERLEGDSLGGMLTGYTSAPSVGSTRQVIAPEGAMPILVTQPAPSIAPGSAGSSGLTINAPRQPETAGGRIVALPAIPGATPRAALSVAPVAEMRGPFANGRDLLVYLGVLAVFVFLIYAEREK